MALMPRSIIDIAGFEAKFQENPDPWNYASSRFEAFKRQILLQACGTRQYGRGLELACANGETSLLLARKSLTLLAVDGSASAVTEAKRRTASIKNVMVVEAALPHEMPRGPFDLIVISELLYYLKPRDLDDLLRRSIAALAPGGRIVVLHHTIYFDDVAIPPAAAQQRAIELLGRGLAPVFRRSLAHFDVVAFAKPYR